MKTLSPKQARTYICEGGTEAIYVNGLLDISKTDLTSLPPGLHCYELNASDTQLNSLPNDIRVECRLNLDNCPKLEALPEGLTTGSVSLRNCPLIRSLPENISTWFLDLSDCRQFQIWPENGTIHRGHIHLRNCGLLQYLPPWLESLAQLDISGCEQLESIPEGLKISSWADIAGTSVSKLPNSLQNVSLRWRGVPINQRIAFHPEQLTAREALEEKNAEKRRVIIERMGYLRFVNDAKANILDADRDPGGTRQLLRIELEDDEDIVGLSCFCPSTGRQYFLRVPPDLKTCQHAAAWIAGYDDPKLYNPIIET